MANIVSDTANLIAGVVTDAALPGNISMRVQLRIANQHPSGMSQETAGIITNTVKDHSKGLFHFIRSRVKTTEDAEDILQDVWHQLSLVINATPIEQMGAWLYKVAGNKIIDRRRKKS